MVKCAECGFLTLRDRSTGELVEVSDDYRASGRVPSDVTAWVNQHNYPICFAMAWDLTPEVERVAAEQFLASRLDEAEATQLAWGERVKQVIQKERVCPPVEGQVGFTSHQLGSTPKEHREMLDRQWMIDREDRRDREQRQWQERQQQADWRFRLWLVVIGGLLVLATSFLIVLYQQLFLD